MACFCQCNSAPKSPGSPAADDAEQDESPSASAGSGWIDTDTQLDHPPAEVLPCPANHEQSSSDSVKQCDMCGSTQKRRFVKAQWGRPAGQSRRCKACNSERTGPIQLPPDDSRPQSPISNGKNIRAREKRKAARDRNRRAQLERQQELLQQHTVSGASPEQLAEDTQQLAELQAELQRQEENSAFGCDLDAALAKACARCGSASCVGCGTPSLAGAAKGGRRTEGVLPPLNNNGQTLRPVGLLRTAQHRKPLPDVQPDWRQLVTASGRPMIWGGMGTAIGPDGEPAETEVEDIDGEIEREIGLCAPQCDKLLDVQLEYFDQYVFISSTDELMQLCLAIVDEMRMDVHIAELRDLVNRNQFDDIEWHFDEFKDWFDREIKAIASVVPKIDLSELKDYSDPITSDPMPLDPLAAAILSEYGMP